MPAPTRESAIPFSGEELHLTGHDHEYQNHLQIIVLQDPFTYTL
jgi:hypothetical protein